MATITGSRGPAAEASAQDTTATHPYTCNSCQVAFRNSDLQKGHMRSDWHRYNLKRRVASLPPISSEVFSEKVLQARASTTAEAERAGFQRSCDACQKTYYSENSYQNHISSQKHKAREAAMAHRQSAALPDDASSVISSTFSLGDPVPTSNPEVDSDAEDEFTTIVEGIKKAKLDDAKSPVKRPSNPHLSAAAQHKTEHRVSQTSAAPPSSASTDTATPVPSSKGSAAPSLTLKSCLFCNYESPTVPLSAVHMERIHGMFIPEKQYLVDLEGLLAALQERIQEFHECLYCGKVKSNAFAVQTHMRDKGHCKIPYSTEEEQLVIGDFYDFRSTYSDDDEDWEDSEDESEAEDRQGGGAKLGAKRSTTTTGQDGDAVKAEDEGWETDSSASSLDSADLTAVPAEQHYHQYERLDKHPHHSHRDPRARHKADGWHSHAHKHTHAAFYDEYELHLPSGKSVGHRSLNRYYRQNLHDYPTAEEREERRLAIESGEAMDVDGGDEEGGSRALTRRDQMSRARALASRANGGSGMQGVTDRKKREVRKSEQRGRTAKTFQERRSEWAVNKQNNHQKYYHYSIL